MDDAPVVGVLDRLGHLARQRGRLARGQWTAGDFLGQARALDEAHAEVVLVLVLADLVDRYDPRVIEPGGGLGLQVKPPDVHLVGELARQDHLERHRAIQADLAGAVDDAHAAAGDLGEQLVVAEVADLARRLRRGR